MNSNDATMNSIRKDIYDNPIEVIYDEDGNEIDEIIHYPTYTFDDAGIEQSRHAVQNNNDCMIRALSIYHDRDYDKWHDIVISYAKDVMNEGVSMPTAIQILNDYGFKQYFVYGGMTFNDVANIIDRDCIIIADDHVAAIRNGRVHDLGNTTGRHAHMVYIKE